VFDLLAPFYDPAMRLAGVTHEEAVEMLRPLSTDLVLDLGGGTGIGAATATHLSGCRALVVDRSRSMLRRARRGEKLTLVLADGAQLPLPNASVDGALILDALHHFSTPVPALREVSRVLKPGRRLVIEELDASRLSIRLLGRMEHLLREPGALWTPEQLVALVRAAGLEVEGLKTAGAMILAVARVSQSAGSK
jgi:demethylmenaquinone methyltransferase/2-methoxy-6-polyprenyl-1,4-benzoquinol methylase